jgi:hypothetical protein
MGDLDLRESSLDLTQTSPAPLEIVLGGSPAEIQGSVQRGETPLPGATVVLIPDTPERRARPSWYRVTRTDQTGKFSLSNVVPAAYHLIAFDDIEEGAWMDPELLPSVQESGIAINAEEGRSQSFTLVPVSTQ